MVEDRLKSGKHKIMVFGLLETLGFGGGSGGGGPKTTEVPGLFGEGTQFSSRLADIFGLDIGGFPQPTSPQAATPFNQTLGINPLFADPRPPGFGGIPQAPTQQLQQGGPTPSNVLGLASAERIAGPSIFDQLGISDFAQRLTQPQGFGRTPEQDALIQELIGITGGATAARGLGAPTAGALASQIAPQLTQFRQQNIENQLATLQGLTGAAGVGGTERLGGISQLLDLTGLSMPTPIVEGGGGGDSGFSDIAALVSAFGSLAAFCHVAEELFGEHDPRTHFARFYCATHDNWFIRIYRKMSKIWAKHLKDNPDLKPIVRPIWENMAYLGHKRYLKWQEDPHQ